METTKPVDHATSPTSGTRAWRGRVRVPTVRNRRMQRGGRLQSRPAAAGQTGTAAPLDATGAHTAGQAGIGRGVSPRPGELSVSLDVTEHADLKRDSRRARAAHHPEW